MDDQRPISHRLTIPAMASAGAAVMHATLAGSHADTVGLARLFIVLAFAQAVAAIVGLIRADSFSGHALVWVNLVAAGGWFVTRLVGFSFIDGLRVAERPTLADTIAAVLALAAAAAAGATLFQRSIAWPPSAIASTAVLVGVLVVPGLAAAMTHEHANHGESAAGVHDHDAAQADQDNHSDHDVAAVTPTGVADPVDAADHDDHADHDAEHDDVAAATSTGVEVDHSETTAPSMPRSWPTPMPGPARGIRPSRSTSPASRVSPNNSSLAPRHSPLTRCVSCRSSPTFRPFPPSATARSATPAPASSTNSTPT